MEITIFVPVVQLGVLSPMIMWSDGIRPSCMSLESWVQIRAAMNGEGQAYPVLCSPMTKNVYIFLISQKCCLTLMNDIQQGSSRSSSKQYADDMSGPLSPMSLPASKQLKFTPGIVNGSVRESVAFLDQTRKVTPMRLAVFEIVVFPFN